MCTGSLWLSAVNDDSKRNGVNVIKGQVEDDILELSWFSRKQHKLVWNWGCDLLTSSSWEQNCAPCTSLWCKYSFGPIYMSWRCEQKVLTKVLPRGLLLPVAASCIPSVRFSKRHNIVLSFCNPIAYARAIWECDDPWLCLRGGTTQIIHYVSAQAQWGVTGEIIPGFMCTKLVHRK